MRGPAPFGFRRQDGRLVPDPFEGSVVRQMAEVFLASGGRMKATAQTLNDQGLATRRGCSWTDVSVARVLRHQGLEGLLPEYLWERCRAFLTVQDQKPGGSGPRRRASHPLGSVLHCRCGGRMYLRRGGPAAKFVCRSCRAKIPVETLERLFCEALAAVEFAADEVGEALSDAPRAAELTRILGGRPVALSEVWPILDLQERRQLVDLVASNLVVGREEISVVLGVSVAGDREIRHMPENSLPRSDGLLAPENHVNE